MPDIGSGNESLAAASSPGEESSTCILKVGQLRRACKAAWRSGEPLSGCTDVADAPLIAVKVSGAIQRQVSQSMHVWSTYIGPETFSGRLWRLGCVLFDRFPEDAQEIFKISFLGMGPSLGGVARI